MPLCYQKSYRPKKNIWGFFSENDHYRFRLNYFPNSFTESYRFHFQGKNQQIYFSHHLNVSQISYLKVTITIS